MMNILIINTGSSSIKYKLFAMDSPGSGTAMAEGMIDRIGEKNSIITHNAGSENRTCINKTIKDYTGGIHEIVRAVTDHNCGVIKDISQIDAVGHRVVHGGEQFSSPVLINDRVKASIKKNISLAPLHNPSNLAGIEASEKIFHNRPNIAVFDTDFHISIPAKAYLYAIPYRYYTEFQIRKYGFHGTSHRYAAQKACFLMNRDINQTNLITLHLGSGCSACAIEKGRCIDTSMGMTPLAGLMMGTRCGDIDPGIIGYLMEKTHMSIKDMEDMLNRQSGLKGISGFSDMRDIHEQAGKGNKNAALALEVFTYKIKKIIGSYTAVLDRVDAVVFTGGIGENDHISRSMICHGLSGLGIIMDEHRNLRQSSEPFPVHSAQSRVQLWVIQADEEMQIAQAAFIIMDRQGQVSAV